MFILSVCSCTCCTDDAAYQDKKNPSIGLTLSLTSYLAFGGPLLRWRCTDTVGAFVVDICDQNLQDLAWNPGPPPQRGLQQWIPLLSPLARP